MSFQKFFIFAALFAVVAFAADTADVAADVPALADESISTKESALRRYIPTYCYRRIQTCCYSYYRCGNYCVLVRCVRIRVCKLRIFGKCVRRKWVKKCYYRCYPKYCYRFRCWNSIFRSKVYKSPKVYRGKKAFNKATSK